MHASSQAQCAQHSQTVSLVQFQVVIQFVSHATQVLTYRLDHAQRTHLLHPQHAQAVRAYNKKEKDFIQNLDQFRHIYFATSFGSMGIFQFNQSNPKRAVAINVIFQLFYLFSGIPNQKSNSSIIIP